MSLSLVVSSLQPRNVAGFRGTVRYASVNAHKNRVSGRCGLRQVVAMGVRSEWSVIAGAGGRLVLRRGKENGAGTGICQLRWEKVTLLAS